MLGFIIGKEGVEKAFNRKFSNKFNIAVIKLLNCSNFTLWKKDGA